eukprot:scaffold23882_cov72-Skeletonema_dohrnii-CCMP3373.AAC.1
MEEEVWRIRTQPLCEKNTGDSNTRLCTPLEVENSCARGTGCNFDKEQVWACAYDGHACEADAECCGSCVNGTCAGEVNLFPWDTSGQEMTQQQQEDVPPKKKKSKKSKKR